VGFYLNAFYSTKAELIGRTPSHLFRHDKPELDKKRLKRFNKIHKNSYVVARVNTGQKIDLSGLFDKSCSININD